MRVIPMASRALLALVAVACAPVINDDGGEGEGEGEGEEGEGEGEEGEGEGEGEEGEGEGEGDIDGIDVIVGVGYGGIRILSVDHGTTWCESAIDDPSGGDDPRLLRDVTYANGRFVAAGWSIWVSDDGWAWDDVTGAEDTPSGQWVGGMAFGDGVWLSCGGFGTSMRATDGRDWAEVDRPGESAGRSIAYGDGVFVCGTDDGWVSTSDNGTTWQDTPALGGSRVAYIDGAFAEHPGSDAGFGVRVQMEGDTVVVANDATPDVYVPRFESRRSIEGFAFGRVVDLRIDAMPAELRTCLGL
jgi:hypothetical protein